MTDTGDVQAMWRERWEDKLIIRPSCYNRPAFVDVVVSQEFGTEYPFRQSRGCPHWVPGGNSSSMSMCDSAGGRKTPWSACHGCIWKDEKTNA